MDLHNLKPAKGSVKSPKRIARGQGSGHGGTSTRGHKGAKSRSGYSRKLNFEGGQTPLQMRVPKRGFKAPFRVEYIAINLSTLEMFADKYKTNKLDLEFFRTNRIIKKTEKIKILGEGKLDTKIEVEGHGISKSARTAIESVGGSFTQL